MSDVDSSLANHISRIDIAPKQEFWSAIFDSLPVGVLVEDLQQHHLFVNRSAALMTGYSVEELMAGVWMVHPDDTEAPLVLERALRDGTAGSNYETRFVRKDGSVFWVSISWNPFRDEAGEMTGLCTIFADISDRKSTQEALAGASERYEMLLNHASDIFSEWDTEGRIVYVSPAVNQLGYTQAELVGLRAFTLVPAEDQPTSQERLKKLLTDYQSLRHDLRVVAKDGSIHWLEAQVDVVVEDGRPARIYAVHRNVTERKLAEDRLAAVREASEEAIRQSEQKYKSIVENSRDLIMLNSPEGPVLYASPALKGMLGYEPEEFVGTLPDVVHPDDIPLARAAFERAAKGESEANYEYRLLTKGGETRWVSHAWSPVFGDDGLQSIISVVRDVTERKEAEEKLRVAHAELEQAYKLQQEFLNSVTHEVRTPLTAVQGYAEMLREGIAGEVSEEQSTLLQKITDSSEHLLDVLNAVLQTARMKSGRIPLKPRVSDPRRIVERCLSTVIPQAKKKGLVIHLHPDPNGTVATYDEEKLTILITNLLSNAVKFTPSGAVEVFLTARPEGCEIIVSDTGVGIAPSALTDIFDEFAQLDVPGKHKPSGFGLGLAIVSAMADSIGASLTVSSERGIGTAFTVWSPALEA